MKIHYRQPQADINLPKDKRMSDTNYTLLIFDWFGERDPGFYLIPNAPEWLDKCDGYLSNSVAADEAGVEDLLSRVQAAICDEPKYFADYPEPEWGGVWVKYKITDKINHTCRIIRTGFEP